MQNKGGAPILIEKIMDGGQAKQKVVQVSHHEQRPLMRREGEGATKGAGKVEARIGQLAADPAISSIFMRWVAVGQYQDSFGNPSV